MTIAATNSALQRARMTLGSRSDLLHSADSLSDEQAALLDRYVAAFENYDVEGLVGVLREDATFSMPPYALWLQGPDSVRGWLLGPGAPCRGSRLVRVAASGSPAFAQYRRVEGTYQAWALIVLELDGASVAGWNSFLDTERLFPMFGLPLQMVD
jgi:RNA polymerase sigma-70 factor (ECF subfamily)